MIAYFFQKKKKNYTLIQCSFCYDLVNLRFFAGLEINACPLERGKLKSPRASQENTAYQVSNLQQDYFKIQITAFAIVK